MVQVCPRAALQNFAYITVCTCSCCSAAYSWGPATPTTHQAVLKAGHTGLHLCKDISAGIVPSYTKLPGLGSSPWHVISLVEKLLELLLPTLRPLPEVLPSKL